MGQEEQVSQENQHASNLKSIHRADNWNRFGQSQQGEGGRGRGGGHQGERGRGGWHEGGRGGNWTPRGGHRGGFGHQSYHTPHGDSVYTPRGRGRGGRGDFTPRGGRGEYTPRGGRGGYDSPRGGGGGYTPTPIGQGQGYFSPQMLQDPWEDLQNEMGWGESGVEGNKLKRKSGEMLQEQESSSENTVQKASKPVAPFYRTGGDGEQERKAWERAKMMAEEEDDFDDVVDESEGGHSGEGLVGDMGLSDSLIPQVGDSFCERSQLLDDEKVLQGTEEENETDSTQS